MTTATQVSEKEIIVHMAKTNVILENLTNEFGNLKKDIEKISIKCENFANLGEIREEIKTDIKNHEIGCPIGNDFKLLKEKINKPSVWPTNIMGWLILITYLITLFGGTLGFFTWVNKVSAASPTLTEERN